MSYRISVEAGRSGSASGSAASRVRIRKMLTVNSVERVNELLGRFKTSEAPTLAVSSRPFGGKPPPLLDRERSRRTARG